MLCSLSASEASAHAGARDARARHFLLDMMFSHAYNKHKGSVHQQPQPVSGRSQDKLMSLRFSRYSLGMEGRLSLLVYIKTKFDRRNNERK